MCMKSEKILGKRKLKSLKKNLQNHMSVIKETPKYCILGKFVTIY